MSPASDRVEGLLTECLLLDPAERRRGLEKACSTHPEHREALRERWRALDEMGLIEEEGFGDAEFPATLGDFDLVRRLGGGGMGVVFLAVQRTLGREVALKIIRPEQVYFPRARDRFRREAEAVAKLSHPGIVPIHVVGEEKGVPYFAMERVAGRTLAEVLEALRGRAPESLTGSDLQRALRGDEPSPEPGTPAAPFASSWVDACMGIARQVADALDHAHARGVLHRDVKPSNVIVSPDGRARLIDFGLTALLESDGEKGPTRTGSQLGTLHYMSPEQVRGGTGIDARTDVYGLGVTLYELLTLQLPYRGSDSVATQSLILDGRPDPIRARNRAVSADAETLCVVAMERDPARRYASASAMRADIDRLLARRPIEARPIGPLVRALRVVQRRPALTGAVLTAVILGIAAPSALYLQQRSHTKELTASLARERDLRQKEAAAREDAETTITFLGNLILDATPERLKGRSFDLREWLAIGEEGIEYLKDRPGVLARYLLLSGRGYLSLGDLDHAIEVLGQAVKLEREHSGDLSAWTLLAIDRLATALETRGRYDEAEGLFRESLAGQIALRGPRHAAVAVTENNLGNLLMLKKDFAGAEPHLRAALEISSSLPDADAATVATQRVNLAILLQKLGRLDDAGVEAEQALITMRGAGADHPVELAQSLNNVGLVRLAIGDESGGVAAFREAVEIYDRIYPDPDVYAAAALHNLGSSLCRAGHRDEGLRDLERAVLAMENAGLADHPNTARFRATLAQAKADAAGGR